MHINLKDDSGEFKYRVVGVMIDKNNRLLVQAVANGQFYCLPGGRVEIGESSKEALARELKEELGFDVFVESPMFLIENFFVSARTNILAHEIGLYFRVSSENAPTEDWNHLDTSGEVAKDMKYKWVDLNDIANVDIRPRFLKEKLLSIGDGFEQLILKNGEITKN